MDAGSDYHCPKPSRDLAHLSDQHQCDVLNRPLRINYDKVHYAIGVPQWTLNNKQGLPGPHHRTNTNKWVVDIVYVPSFWPVTPRASVLRSTFVEIGFRFGTDGDGPH